MKVKIKVIFIPLNHVVPVDLTAENIKFEVKLLLYFLHPTKAFITREKKKMCVEETQ